MKGQNVSQSIIESIFVDEALNFKVSLQEITLKSGETLANIDSTKIVENGFSYEDAIGSDDKFDAIGSAIVRSITVSIYNIDNMYSDYDFEGMTCYVYISQAATVRYERFGKFIVNESVYSDNIITLTMLDIMSKLDVPYIDSVGQYPVTLSTMLQRIRVITGVSIELFNLDEDRLFVLNNYRVYSALDSDSVTCRDVLGWIAGIIGCFATTNPCYSELTHGYYVNVITFRWPGCSMLTIPEPNFRVVDENGDEHTDAKLLTSNGDEIEINDGTAESTGASIITSAPLLKSFYNRTIAVSDSVITGVKVVVNEIEDSDTYEYLCGTDDYFITISNNQLITNNTAQDVADFIGSKLLGLAFRKCSVTHVGNILLEAGDFVYILDNKNNAHRILITRTTINIGSAQEIICGCEDVAANGRMINSRTTKVYSAAKQKISKLREEIDALANELDQQYFWHDESGQHVGSHITQQKRTDFIQDPEHGGYNAHFTTSSLKLRDGLTTLSEFANDHVQIGKNDGVRNYIAPNRQTIYDPYGTKLYEIRTDTNSDGNTNVNYNGTLTITLSETTTGFFSPDISFSALVGSNDADLVVSLNSCTGTLDGFDCTITLAYIDYDNKIVRFRFNGVTPVSTETHTFVYRLNTTMHMTTFKLRLGTESDTSRYGTNSVTIGENNASTMGSGIAIGSGIEVNQSRRVALGRYNATDSSYVFEVGTGNNAGDRRTSFAITGSDIPLMHVDLNASTDYIDGDLSEVMESLGLTSYLFNFDSADDMLNLKRLIYKLLDFNRIYVVYQSRPIVSNNGRTWSSLIVYNNGRIEYDASNYYENQSFHSISGSTEYRSDNVYHLNYPSIIRPDGTYALICDPVVTVNVITQKELPQGSSNALNRVFVNGGTYPYGINLRERTQPYSIKSTGPDTEGYDLQIVFHVVGRWR